MGGKVNHFPDRMSNSITLIDFPDKDTSIWLDEAISLPENSEVDLKECLRRRHRHLASRFDVSRWIYNKERCQPHSCRVNLIIKFLATILPSNGAVCGFFFCFHPQSPFSPFFCAINFCKLIWKRKAERETTVFVSERSSAVYFYLERCVHRRKTFLLDIISRNGISHGVDGRKFRDEDK